MSEEFKKKFVLEHNPSVTFRRADGGVVAVIKDGVFRVRVDPTDGLTREFLTMLQNAAKQTITKVEAVDGSPEYPAPHQLRVVTEHNELAEKLGKLSDFLQTETFATLDKGEQDRLDSQLHIMRAYRAVLIQRVEAMGLDHLLVRGGRNA